MIEACADVDDAIMAKFLDGKADEITEAEIVAALRKGCTHVQVLPGPLRLGVQEQGRSAAARRGRQLPAVAARHPAGQGRQPGQRQGRGAQGRRQGAVRRLRVQDHQRPARQPDVLPRLLGHDHERARWSSNSTRGKRERIGRILRMHANKREELTEADAGNIYAAVGLKDTRTGDTLCDEKKPIILEKMIFPEPVISIADRAEDQGRRREARRRAAEARRRRPVVPRPHRRRVGPDDHQRHGRAPPRHHLRPPEARVQGRVERRQARGRVPRGDQRRRSHCEYKYAKQSGGRGQYGHVLMEIEPGERGTGFVFENDIVGGVIPKEFIPAIEKGVREAMERGVLAGFPHRRHALPPLRRQLPRRRLERAGVRNRGVALLPGRREARGPAPPRADHEERSRRPRAVHGRRHRRPQLAPRQDPRHEPARQRAGHRLRGPARARCSATSPTCAR